MLATPLPHPAQRPVAVADTQLFDWKGIVHCHSYLSHDSKGTIPEIAAACTAAQIDFLVMTDHQTDASIRDGQRGVVGDTLFLVGCEQRSPQGTILAFPLSSPLRHWQHAGLMIKDTQAQGGVAFFCHAETWTNFDIPGANGLEIVNLHAGALGPNKLGTLLTGILLPLRFLFERISWRDDGIFRNWDAQLQKRHPFTPIGGNDAHASIRTLGPLGGTIGNYREVFLTMSTHVLAKERSEAAIVNAFALGRTYVAFDIFGEGAGFDFRALDTAGVHLPGDTVTQSPSLQLAVRTPQAGRIQLLRDGVILQEVTGDQLNLRSPQPGIYRIEVRTRHDSPWLFSSSIRVIADGQPQSAALRS
ncbi:MAG: hypothetical protein NT107_11885 [Planctomycetota bacterium]|nr:hypothetical protein [Planctomycetota bacterium]